MKRLLILLIFVFVSGIAFTSCRDSNKADAADMEVKENGDKVKIKTDDKTIKIKKDEDGNVTKKVKTHN
ncbi:MAG: hypothetical protein WCD31_04590 [Gillisia sp.]